MGARQNEHWHPAALPKKKKPHAQLPVSSNRALDRAAEHSRGAVLEPGYTVARSTAATYGNWSHRTRHEKAELPNARPPCVRGARELLSLFVPRAMRPSIAVGWHGQAWCWRVGPRRGARDGRGERQELEHGVAAVLRAVWLGEALALRRQAQHVHRPRGRG